MAVLSVDGDETGAEGSAPAVERGCHARAGIPRAAGGAHPASAALRTLHDHGAHDTGSGITGIERGLHSLDRKSDV